MKRILSTLLLLSLLISMSVASADFAKMEGDFSIRGGIQFGMTPEEVKSIEKGSASEKEKKDYFEIGYGGFDSLAGIPIYRAKSDIITYQFDMISKKLVAVNYWFGYYDGSADAYFNELCTTIAAKYGAPYNDNNGKVFNVITPALESWINLINMGFSYKVSNLSDWILEYDDYYVLINVFTLRDADNNSDQLLVGYKFITRDEMARILENAESEIREKEKQRNNDI